MLGYARRIDSQRFSFLGIGSTVDISAGGLRFVAYELIPERAELEIELVLDGRPARIDGACVLRSLSQVDGTCEIAVSFEVLSLGARRTILAFIADRNAGQRVAG
jgi:hypothetical protein